MAYLILTSKGRETGRRQLAGPLTIGRAPDCDLAVRDVLLSRHHCRIEPRGAGWVVVDLASKNGTWLDGQRVGRRSFRYDEELRVGKTTIRLMAGELPEVPNLRAETVSGAGGAGGEQAVPSRPADPFEALAGTVAGAVFDPSEFEPAGDRSARDRRPLNRFPTPRPMPPEPAAYARDDVYSMLSEIASSSWDSIYANASRPTRPAPRVVLPPVMTAGGASTATPPPRPQQAQAQHTQAAAQDPRTTERRLRRRRHQVDLALQAPVQLIERSARPVRPAFPLPVPSGSAQKQPGSLRRVWERVARILARVRRKIAPQGAVMLF